jgi:uncharacterized protein YwlG (UPF0340 family)
MNTSCEEKRQHLAVGIKGPECFSRFRGSAIYLFEEFVHEKVSVSTRQLAGGSQLPELTYNYCTVLLQVNCEVTPCHITLSVSHTRLVTHNKHVQINRRHTKRLYSRRACQSRL